MTNGGSGKRYSSIHAAAPLILFCFFAVSAILVILLGARIYENSVRSSDRSSSARTAVSYITEKIHRADSAAAVSVGSFDGIPALVIREDSSESSSSSEGRAGAAESGSFFSGGGSETSENSPSSESGNDTSTQSESASNQDYCTFIYEYGGKLCELTALPDSGADAESGTPILSVQSFSIEKTGNGIFSFSCTDNHGNSFRGIAAVRSAPESSHTADDSQAAEKAEVPR